MDAKSIKELEILNEVSKHEHLNQRYLSKKLNMASGLVNLYIKRLAQKGYIKVTGINRRRLKYLLTPSGIAEKTRLTYEFAIISYKYFKGTTDDIRKKLYELQQEGQAEVVVLGDGELVELCLLLIKDFDIRVIAVVGDRAEEKKFLGYPVVPLEVLPDLKFDKIIVAEIDGAERMDLLLSKLGIKADKIGRLLEVSTE